MSNVGTAPKLESRDNGSVIHFAADPEPLLVDTRGDALTPKKEGIVVKLDSKGSEEITLRKSTIFMMSTMPALAVALLMLVFSYGGSLLGWTREDQEVRTQVQTMSRQMDDLNRKFDKLSEDLVNQRIKDAETRGQTQGFKLGLEAK